MKNRWKHIFIPVLTMALCLSLAACGSGDVTGRLAYHRRGGRQRHHHP